MERNEFGRLDSVSITSIITKMLIVAFSFTAMTFASKAQYTAPSTGKPLPKKYSIKVDYPSHVASSYALTEKTIVKRDYRDDQHKNYEREVTYYFTMGKVGETDNGLTKILCNIDSLRYTFKENNKTLHYDSQEPRNSNIKGEFADLTYTQAPLNHMFVMLLDNKNTIVDINGNNEDNDIEWLRKYILVDGADVMDTAQKFLWLDGISRNRLQTLVDLNGGLIRERMLVGEDSTWSQPSLVRLDGIEFSDTLTAKVATVSRGVYSVETIVSGLKADRDREHRMFGIPAPASVDSTISGSGKTKLKLNKEGSIRAYDADYSAVIQGHYQHEKFVQSINTSIRCIILSQFEW